MKKVSVILTNRDTLQYLKIAIESLRLNNEPVHEIIVLDDNSKDGSKEWIKKNAEKYGFNYWLNEEKDRMGLMILNEKGISLAKNDIIFLGHSDMYYGKDCIKNLIKYLKPKTVVCSTRIEPPIYSDEWCRYQRDYGMTADEFMKNNFNVEVERLKTNKVTVGVFAPTMLYKKDWFGYDLEFLPQSREDDDIFYTMKKKGYNFIQSWSSFVYHFSGKGSRHKDNSLNDTEEWKKSNYKNTRNFIRKHKTIPRHNKWHNPQLAPNISLTLCVATFNDENRIGGFLEKMEPFFDEIVIADESEDNTLNVIEAYKEKETKISKLFNPNKIKIFKKKLNGDYSELRNFMNKQVTSDWVLHADTDENYSMDMLTNLRFVIDKLKNNTNVIGFPRANYLDGILVNDIPRHLWNRDYLNKVIKHEREKQRNRPR